MARVAVLVRIGTNVQVNKDLENNEPELTDPVSLDWYSWLCRSLRARCVTIRNIRSPKVDEPSKEVIVPPYYSIWILR
jgi:hypothetical protein